jgi:cyclophilin family peptidyl-prolyl cis-trans isomerase
MKRLATVTFLLLCFAHSSVGTQDAPPPPERPGFFTLTDFGVSVDVRCFTQKDRIGFEFHVAAPLQPDDTEATLGMYLSAGKGELRYFAYMPCAQDLRRSSLLWEDEEWAVDEEALEALAGFVSERAADHWVATLLLDPVALGSNMSATWRVGFDAKVDAGRATSVINPADRENLPHVQLTKLEARKNEGSKSALTALESEARVLAALANLSEITDPAERLNRVYAALKADATDAALHAALYTHSMLGELEARRKALERALAEWPWWCAGHKWLMELLIARHDVAAAADHFLKYEPTINRIETTAFRDFISTGWRALAAARKWKELSASLARVDKKLAAAPVWAYEIRRCAETVLKGGNVPLALQLRDQLIGNKPESSTELRTWWFDTLASAGRYEEALAEFRALLALEGMNAESFNTMEKACIHAIGAQLDPPQAVEECNSLIKRGTDVLSQDFKDALTEYADACAKVADAWAQELEFRKADAAKQNPRVRVKTDHGEFVIELFEDDVPNTVANFVKLVQDEFYTNRVIYRREPGWIVQGGGRDDDPAPSEDWGIKNEANSRRHWRGTIALARTADPDSGNTHFFITIGNSPVALGLSTDWVVFGRVVEGLAIAQRLQKDDSLHTVTAENLRDHAYVPVRITKED